MYVVLWDVTLKTEMQNWKEQNFQYSKVSLLGNRCKTVCMYCRSGECLPEYCDTWMGTWSHSYFWCCLTWVATTQDALRFPVYCCSFSTIYFSTIKPLLLWFQHSCGHQQNTSDRYWGTYSEITVRIERLGKNRNQCKDITIQMVQWVLL